MTAREFLNLPETNQIMELSPGTAKRDVGDKFDLYERFGVGEFWVVDAKSRFVQVYTRRDGRFARLGVFGAGESFASPVLNGAAVGVARLFG